MAGRKSADRSPRHGKELWRIQWCFFIQWAARALSRGRGFFHKSSRWTGQRLFTAAWDTIYRSVSEAGSASKFAKSLVLFHVGLKIRTLITFLSYSGNTHETQKKAPLTPSHLLCSVTNSSFAHTLPQRCEHWTQFTQAPSPTFPPMLLGVPLLLVVFPMLSGKPCSFVISCKRSPKT